MNVFECLSYMSYIYMRKHHKEDISGQEISFKNIFFMGVSPRTVQLGGVAPDENIPFPLMTKGERLIRCRAKRHGSRGSDGHRGSMCGMTSLLHQSVSINAK
jgi:hypothetical protein